VILGFLPIALRLGPDKTTRNTLCSLLASLMKAGVQQLWNQLKNGNSCEASRVDLSPWPPMQNRGLAYQSLHSLPLV